MTKVRLACAKAVEYVLQYMGKANFHINLQSTQASITTIFN